MRAPRALGAALLAVLPVAATAQAPATTSHRSTDDSARSRQLLCLECASDIGRREITLFANGTVRLREGEVLQDTFEPSELGASWQAPGLTTHLYLGELEPAELETYLRRLRHENLAETEERYGGVVAGEWVEHCSLELALPGRPARRFDFGRYDSLDLALSRVVAIIDELPDHVQREEGAVRGIPGDYQPAVGDVLERRDGNLFELVLFTSDGLGVELQGVDQPVSFIVSFDDLRTDFVRLVERP